jgi:hypothetical protein
MSDNELVTIRFQLDRVKDQLHAACMLRDEELNHRIDAAFDRAVAAEVQGLEARVAQIVHDELDDLLRRRGQYAVSSAYGEIVRKLTEKRRDEMTVEIAVALAEYHERYNVIAGGE